jgi:hypothetical protein
MMGARDDQLQALKRIAMVRAVQELRAEGQAAAAMKAVVTARSNLEGHVEHLADTMHGWSRGAGHPAVHPDLILLWQRELSACGRRIHLAKVACSEAEGNHHDALAGWHAAKLRAEQAGDTAKVAQRRNLRHQEERRMAELADRVSFDWFLR